MSTDPHDKAEVEQRLWKEISKGRYGMLGLTNVTPAQHFQPMTAFAEPETGQIWFFTRNDTDLARTAERGGQAMFVVQAKDQELQACIGGYLRAVRDPDRIDKYWGPMVAAWYPEGKEDPRLTLLRLDVADAQVWLSEQGPLKFAFEIAKANLTGKEPDVGSSAALDLRGRSATHH